MVAALESGLSTGAVRVNPCSQEFLWIQPATVALLFLRQDDFFAWVPVENEPLLDRSQYDWWQPMQLRANALSLL